MIRTALHDEYYDPCDRLTKCDSRLPDDVRNIITYDWYEVVNFWLGVFNNLQTVVFLGDDEGNEHNTRTNAQNRRNVILSYNIIYDIRVRAKTRIRRLTVKLVLCAIAINVYASGENRSKTSSVGKPRKPSSADVARGKNDYENGQNVTSSVTPVDHIETRTGHAFAYQWRLLWWID